jgi:hypothetical protein
MPNPSTVTHPAVSGGGIGFGTVTNPGSDANYSPTLLL